MGHYKANLRDIEFNLFEVFGRGELLGTGPYADLDEETARALLGEMRTMAEGPLAESFADADRNPPVFDPATSTVTLPDSFKKSYRTYVEAGWSRLPLPADVGGPGIPRPLSWAAAEMVLGATPAIHMYACGPPSAYILRGCCSSE